jgi:uncharacterized protein YdiU (UPF0061 family)
MTTSGLSDLHFENSFIQDLPADPEPANFRRQVRNACYSRVLPTKVARPQLIAWSREVAEFLDLQMMPDTMEEFAEVLSGNEILPGMDPFAMCYGGHQFGTWAGQLGDGRAINLGEVINLRGQRWMLQLKGSGATPYSRTADGLAVLRSSLREFLCSEAMFHLGVPTTRALSLVLTGEEVVRDMFYDGNPQREPGAIVCRVAPSFTRFGNFQIHAARGELEVLRRLVDHTIRIDFPHLGEPSIETYRIWFAEVCRTTAEMVLHWMRVGFVHGVMNTDNMSILGQTIDYGPYGWMDNYDPHWTPNTTDASGRRYCFGNQPQIALWNLAQLANALVSLFPSIEPLQSGVDLFSSTYNTQIRTMHLAKIGLEPFEADGDGPALTGDLLEILTSVETDMTIFYRRLAEFSCEPPATPAHEEVSIDPLLDAWYHPEQLTDEYRAKVMDWLQRYQMRARQQGITDLIRRQRMNAVNPKFVLRNYMAQLAIDKAEAGDYSLIDELLELLRHPYDEQPGKDHFAVKRPDWARNRAGCSMLSCSS